MARRLPIRVRLTLGFALAMAAVLAVVGLFVYRRVGNELLGTVDQTLVTQAHEELSAHPAGVDADSEGTLAQLYQPDGRLVASHPHGLPSMLPQRLVVAGRTRRVWRNEQLSVDGERGEWRVLAASGDGGTVAVVARSLDPRADSLRHLRHELLVFLPLALLAASVGGYALTARALHPVEELRRRAQAVNADEATLLPVPPARDEISRLAVTLNDMLARLHSAVERERRFVADASHELRTPLALLQTELDLALRRPRTRDELETALRSAIEETQRLSRLADDLLLIARADRGSLPMQRERVAAGDLLLEAAARFKSRTNSLGRDLRVLATDAHIDADPTRVGQALLNLVDNALTHGAGAIELAAQEHRGFVELHVRDAGTGFPAAFRRHAFERFSRADEARRRGGSGLGLSIVDLVARAHGGGVGLSNSPGGGADVWIWLPQAQPPSTPSTEAPAAATST
jgi:two-component system, OmpR family, sensor kinase